MTALLHILGSGKVRDGAVIELLRERGLEIHDASPLAEPDELADVVMIAPDVDAPLQVARKIRGRDPDAHIVFLTTRENDATLRRELLVARLGTEWTVATADEPPAAAEAVQRAVAVTERRKHLRTTLGRINQQLAQGATGAQRRVLISDHFLASVLDQLPDAVVVLDRSGAVLAYNSAAARAFATLRKGASFLEALPPEVGQVVRSASGTAAGTAESMVVAGGGTEYSLRVTTLRDDAGAHIGTAVVARDITEARRAEKRRQLVAEAVRVLSSTLDAGVALQRLTTLVVSELGDMGAIDVADGDVMRRYAVAGRTPREQALMEQTRVVNAATSRDHPSLVAIARGETVVRNRVDDTMLRVIATSDEHYQMLRELAPKAFVVAPLRAGEETIGAILVARGREVAFSRDDIDTIEEIARQAATALRNIWSYHAIDEASRLKDEFLATLSHELRTPMTSILGWAQMLRLDDTPPEMIRDGLQSIERSGRAQAQLIDDLLDLSRMQMGKLQFQLRPMALSEVVRAAVETIRPAAQARGVELTVDVSADVTAAGDPDRIQQVIWNLLSNAVKFSDRGGEVRVSLEMDDASARIVVADRGRGIDPQFLPHVFERFRQADSATTRRFGGLGLGLTIVKQLVEMHGGTVSAESGGLGNGATFIVTLPRTGMARDAQSRLAEQEPHRLADLRGLSVLVVEDEPASAALLRTILERAGAQVRTASSVQAALEWLRTQIPDVLVSDVAMPDEDGLALIRAVRGILHIPAERLPAIALTAFSDVNLRVTVLGSGFQRFMTKPVAPATLTSAVATLARRG